MPKITHILFDCDNTLVLSEELAFEACADIANEILEKNGIEQRYTGEQLIGDFVGQNFRGMMVSIQAKFNITLTPEELEAYVKEEENRVIAKLEAKAQPCVGVTEVLVRLFAEGKYGMAVVSSSALRRVKASIKKVDQDKFFPEDHIFSAATSLDKPTTKPDPAIYLHSLKVIGKEASECVAIEDSKSGALSAVRAGIPVIAYVGSYPTTEKQDEMAKTLLDLGAKVVMKNWSEWDDCIAQIEKMDSSL
ncbi:HAD superfamily hydrolase [Arthroderma uncinatum]|uniref:HAD superfamily hydrolase n=1 Tax=Arthroderma uncinatum TaxID=74035 RepID=UPI00144A9431|nr:HAD superfamily hydrolase [Arthroderma uncinatum]KAF3479849.1 HAD superfamily hydrolase [Arthroderma uncinatum]